MVSVIGILDELSTKATRKCNVQGLQSIAQICAKYLNY